jgi:alcohol dehydrogenase class IV
MAASAIGSYDFVAPRRIAFGWGRFAEIGPLAAGLGTRAFLVTGSRTVAETGWTGRLRDGLARHGVEPVELAAIAREPEVADVDEAVRRIRARRAAEPGEGDLVIALGGGSAIDLAKATAALATDTQGESVRDYLEGVGRGLTINVAPLPMIAVPTTAGTGSEATKNAVISSYDPPFKKSLRSDWMTPQAVVVDPELTVTLPPSVTAHTGMDAITQLIESYLSRKSRPIARALAADGLRLAQSAIEEAVEQPSSQPARESMAHAALLSGLALANSGLGMAHGVAAALGIHLRVPHGLACAVLLPIALAANRPTCEMALAELAKAAGIADGGATAAVAADALIGRIGQICQRLGVPLRLSDLGVAANHIPALVRDSRGNSMSGNPRELSDAELAGILAAHL